jgi:hypothetical protein
MRGVHPTRNGRVVLVRHQQRQREAVQQALGRAFPGALLLAYLDQLAGEWQLVGTKLESAITLKLEDQLFHLRRDLGVDSFPRTAGAYLEDWASDRHGWLRKYFVEDSDEPARDRP